MKLLLTICAGILWALPAILAAAGSAPVRVGPAAYGDWRGDAPGVRRKITPADLPPPFVTPSAGNDPEVVPRPAAASPRVLPAFQVDEFARGLDHPRLIRVAPNGDIFIAESVAGRIRLLRAVDGATRPNKNVIFASGLTLPFGINFWPPGPNPNYLYVANTDSVVRFPYRCGDLRARGPAQTVVGDGVILIPAGGRLRGGGHWTRDLVFSPDGARMFVSVGSHSNDAETLAQIRLPEAIQYDQRHGQGSSWGSEARRADVLEFSPQGGDPRIFATGLRNCVGMAIEPLTGALWCSTNERDGLGDNLPPDYVTQVRDGNFFGWPWYYIGAHEDPFHRGQRPDLRDKVSLPEVLIQPHSASLEMTFYQGHQFPKEYLGDAFAAEHGSWNRRLRTGYKVIRIIMRNGRPTGVYEDFMTGFVTPSGDVWGRPVGVAVAHDGALLITEDAGGTVWRVSYSGRAPGSHK